MSSGPLPASSFSLFCFRVLFGLSLMLFCALLASPVLAASRPTPIGIDFGSEFIKISSVKAGAGSYHIVVDEQSKRKVPACVAFEAGERFFGNGATQFAAKRPHDTFFYAHRVAGKGPEAPAVRDLVAQGYPYDFTATERTSAVGYRRHVHTASTHADTSSPHADRQILSVEEVLAMSLEHVQRIAQVDADAAVSGAVIVVPNHWTQVQRQAMLDAAELASLNVYALLNENTAAALQYGIDRKYDNETKPHTVLLYNMGATSTKVSVMTFDAKQVKDGRKNRTEGHLEIHSLGFDDSLGGQYFEAILSRHVAGLVNEQLQKKGKNDNVYAHPRAMAKIRLAAEKAKIVLSANQETQIHLASLIHDIDFKMTITREQFYGIVQPLIARVHQPVDDALLDANLTIGDVDSVIIIGGGTRIPAVQDAIKQHLKIDKLGQGLDGDDSMAMGAEFKSIELSKLFKTRPFSMEDVTPYGVSVALTDLVLHHESDGSDTSQESASVWSKTTSLFKRYSRLSKRKTLSFPHDRDFVAALFYDENTTSSILPPDTATNVLMYEVIGLEAAKINPKYMPLLETQRPRVSAVFLLDQSGLVTLVSAEATLEETVQVPVVKESAKKSKKNVSEFVNGTQTLNESLYGDNETASQAVESDSNSGSSAESAEENSTEASAESSTESTQNNITDTAATAEVEYTEKKITHKIPLIVTIAHHPKSPRPMNYTEKQEARTRLNALRAADELKKAIARARNELESFIYNTRSIVNDGKWDQVSTSEMRDELFTALSEAEDWLYEQADDSAAVFVDKLNTLKSLSTPIATRFSEQTDLPNALEAAYGVLNVTRAQVAEYNMTRPWLKADDLQLLSNLTEEASIWLGSRVEQQSHVQPWEEPIVRSSEILEHFTPIVQLSQRLSKIRKPAEPKPKTVKSKANATRFNSTTVEDTIVHEDSSGRSDMPTGDSDNNYAGSAPSSATDEEGTSSATEPELNRHDDEL